LSVTFPNYRSPISLRKRFILVCDSALLEFLTCLWPPDLSIGPAPPEFCSPQRNPLNEPHMGGTSTPPGSTLRLSQPHSGFLASPSFVALFRATTVPRILPSEISPRFESRTPLEAALLPCGYPPACRTVIFRALSPPVSTTPALTRRSLLPPSTMSSLFTPPEGHASRSLWARRIKPIRSASFTRFEALILSRVRSR